MKVLVIIITYAFCFTLVDSRIFRRRSFKYYELNTSLDISDQKQKRKRTSKKYKNKKYKRPKIYQQKGYKLSGSFSKDKRYSNQRSLRRMFING